MEGTIVMAQGRKYAVTSCGGAGLGENKKKVPFMENFRLLRMWVALMMGEKSVDSKCL